MATRAPDNAYRDEETMEPGSYQLSMSVLMTPDKANFSGNVHGGALLKSSTKWRSPAPSVMQAVTWSPFG